MNYPLLPEPASPGCKHGPIQTRDYYTADQMRAYVDADRAQRGEPVAWFVGEPGNYLEVEHWAEGAFPVYTAPPEPEAVALLRELVAADDLDIGGMLPSANALDKAFANARAFLEKQP